MTVFDWKIERLRKGIKLKDIALYVKVTPSLLSMCENGKAVFTPKVWRKYKEFILEHDNKN